MSLIVQKFGGTSVADDQRIFHVAQTIVRSYQMKNDIVVVVSAQGDTTDRLVEQAKRINSNGSKREIDMLLCAGEQMSVSLLALAIEKIGYPVISLTGWQAGVRTNSDYGSARILKINADRIYKELDKKRIVIVAGFQGINSFQDITTMGRGGSDTSAVALAAELKADLCQIYTDVDGVYTADPRLVPNAVKLREISFDEMLELATSGAKVLHNRSVEMAKKYSIDLEVLSSLEGKPGTKVKEIVNMEKMIVRGVAIDDDIARIAILHLPDSPEAAFKVFSLLAKKKINVDIIMQSAAQDNKKDIYFTVPASQMQEAKDVLESHINHTEGIEIEAKDGFSKVTIVGAGMKANPGVAAKMFEALAEARINSHLIATSEIKVSVLVNTEEGKRALKVVHEAFLV